MSNPVFTAVDKMPFSGKFSIRDSIKSYAEASPENEKKKFLTTTALLGGMAIGHTFQAYLGYNALSTHTEQFSQDGQAIDGILTGIDSVYMIANGLVAARQAALISRVNTMRQKKNERARRRTSTDFTPHITTLSETATKKRNKAMGTALAVTVAGQALFMGSLFNSSNPEPREFGEVGPVYVIDTSAPIHQEPTKSEVYTVVLPEKPTDIQP